jgi:zinc protease
MKNTLIALALVTATFVSSCGDSNETAAEKKDYISVENDPMETRIYTLENGMKVYISVNREKPRIQTNIAVRAGSKNDPSDATGLAHYLEHMLFKGSSQIGTMDWEKEAPLLKKISDLYEEHRNTTDPEKRKRIYAQIDSVSYEASKFAIPNEYDKMISSLGAKGTNAFTSYEQTVYVNDIPSNEFEKWLMLESARFKELTLRLFHTELETVYEEFNRGQDNDYRKVYAAVDSLLFLNHEYGTQTTIGTGEHLKNPSMEKIHEYFSTYYVPNNMAIILAGDLDPDAAFEKIKKYFGNYETKAVPEYSFQPEEPISAPREKTVYGPRSESVTIGFRAGGTDSGDEPLYASLVSEILTNGQVGLIDLNLMQKQKVLSAYAYYSELKDYGKLVLSAEPKDGQTLEEARDLLLAELEKFKKGEFEDWMLEASVNNYRLQQKKYLESNNFRAYMMRDAFITGKDWSEVVNTDKKLAAITKDQLVDYANKNFNNNYVIVYKRTGEDKSLHKVEKPKITPVQINREVQSPFAVQFDTLESERLNPLFVDYKSALDIVELSNGLKLTYSKNENNDLFYLYYLLDMGGNHDPKLQMALKYLPFLGTDKYSVEDIKKEFFKMGIEYDVFASSDQVYVYCSGLEESFEKGVELFEHLLANAQPNEEALAEMINDELKERQNKKLEKFYIHQYGMGNYAKYGEENYFNDVMSTDELKAITAQELVDRIKSLTNYKHEIFYYGSREKGALTESLPGLHNVEAELMDYPTETTYAAVKNDKNRVYFVDYDMVQTEILLVSEDGMFDKSVWPYARIFNEYFGAGLSSIMFQEIRESKGLAYTAYSYYAIAGRSDFPSFVQAYVGTQRDKLQDAMKVLLELMNDMPEANDQFEDAKLAALKKIESERIVNREVFWNYRSLKKRGIDYDIRKEHYETIKNMSMDDLKKFFEDKIANRKYTFCVIGKKSDIDFNVLAELGEVKELSLEEVFGY